MQPTWQGLLAHFRVGRQTLRSKSQKKGVETPACERWFHRRCRDTSRSRRSLCQRGHTGARRIELSHLRFTTRSSLKEKNVRSDERVGRSAAAPGPPGGHSALRSAVFVLREDLPSILSDRLAKQRKPRLQRRVIPLRLWREQKTRSAAWTWMRTPRLVLFMKGRPITSAASLAAPSFVLTPAAS